MTHRVDDPDHVLTDKELEQREAARLGKIDNMRRAPTKNLKSLLNPDLKSIRKPPVQLTAPVSSHAETTTSAPASVAAKPAPAPAPAPTPAPVVHHQTVVHPTPAPAPTPVAQPVAPAPAPTPAPVHVPAPTPVAQPPPAVHHQPAAAAAQPTSSSDSQPKFCPFCGTPSGPGPFCSGCGSKIVGPNVPATPVNYTPAPKAASLPVTRHVKEDWEQAPSAPQYGTRFEQMILAELILARTNPGAVVEKLQLRKRFYKGLEFDNAETGTRMTTAEGAQAVDEALDYCLARLRGLGDKARLKPYDGLHKCARDFCAVMAASLSQTETAEQAEKRLSRYGRIQGTVGQSVALANLLPEEIVLDWIIDDGQKSRPNRNAVFNGEFQALGIASGPHTAAGRITTVIFAKSFIPESELAAYEALGQAPPANFTGGGASSSSSSGNVTHTPTALSAPSAPPTSSAPSGPLRSFPAYQVGQLTAVEKLEGSAPYTSANLLPISHLGCAIEDMTLRITSNGRYLEFTRSNGETREVQGFNLPYQVLESTVSAKYYPSENQGTLYVRLGKPGLKGGVAQGEHTVHTFTVPANPSSNVHRVVVHVDQGNDSYRFYPGPATKYDTNFTVVLVGAVLEFRTVFSEPEGNVVKTIHGKQSVQLPTPPGLDQISVNGNDLIVRTKASDAQYTQADAAVQITLG